MRKSLGVKPAVFPMPVLMIATYGEDDVVDVMNMAWGGICDTDKIALNITESHKTAANIKAHNAFTISIADRAHMVEADFFGIASGNRMADKFERSGLTATRSQIVDAPIIEEFPVTLECEVVQMARCEWGFRVVGQIKDVTAHEEILDEEGNVDITKLDAIMFDQFNNGYYATGEKVGQAWNAGAGLMKA